MKGAKMSEPNNEGKELVKQLRATTKAQNKAKLLDSNAAIFTIRLSRTISSLLILALGAIVLFTPNWGVSRLAAIVCAICTICNGSFLIYKALMDDKLNENE